MADEIADANTITLVREDGLWHARVGPGDGRGVSAHSETPRGALEELAWSCDLAGWCWDGSWRPRAGGPETVTVRDADSAADPGGALARVVRAALGPGGARVTARYEPPKAAVELTVEPWRAHG